MSTRLAPQEVKRRRRIEARAALEAKLRRIDKGYRSLTSGIAARDRAAAQLAKAEARCGGAIAELVALDLGLDEIEADTEIPRRELRRLLRLARAEQALAETPEDRPSSEATVETEDGQDPEGEAAGNDDVS